VTGSARSADGVGIRLARAFFQDVVSALVRRVLPEAGYDAALIGPGSEVLGFDTTRSADHDYGPRVQIFVRSDRVEAVAEAVEHELDADLPTEYRGFPTRYQRSGAAPLPAGTRPPHHVEVTDVAAWSRVHLGVDATGPLTVTDWLGLPWQLLAAATGGAVFHSGLGALDRWRATLAWYPDDVWRYVLAAQWHRIGQEEPFLGRTGEVGDDLGSALLAGRLVRDVMRLVMLLRRRYPPYAKWLGTAFRRTADAEVLGPDLIGAVRAGGWRAREEHLCRAYEYVAGLHNSLDICAPVDPSCRNFWDRPFRVLDADRFATALRDAVTDPAVGNLPLIGNVDQIADNTDVLSHSGRSHTIGEVLFRQS
jgi:hypothetical protein